MVEHPSDFENLTLNPPLRTAKKNPKLTPVKQNLVPATEAMQYAFMVLDSFDSPKKSICGSLRRQAEMVHDIDLLIGHEESCDSTHDSLVAKELNIPIDIRHIALESWGSALQYFTGSREHNIWLRTIAKRNGLSLSEYGFTPTDAEGVRHLVSSEFVNAHVGVLTPIQEERTVYNILGLRWLPPQFRNFINEYVPSDEPKKRCHVCQRQIRETDMNRHLTDTHKEWIVSHPEDAP